MSNGQWLIPPGVVMAWGGASPSGNNNAYLAGSWLYCDGSSYQTSQYQDLFNAIGSNFGSSGPGYFNVPDLQGYFLRGVDTSGQERDPNSSTRAANNPGGETGLNAGSTEADCVGQNGVSQGGSATPFSAAFPVQVSKLNAYDNNFHPGYGLGNIPGGQFYNAGGGPDPNVVNKPTSVTFQNLGQESRPKNVYVYYVICTGIPMPS